MAENYKSDSKKMKITLTKKKNETKKIIIFNDVKAPKRLVST